MLISKPAGHHCSRAYDGSSRSPQAFVCRGSLNQVYQFQRTVDTDALALFDGQRVISFFQFDSRTNSTVTQVDKCLEVKRIRIYGQARTKPTEKWANMAS